MADLLTLEGMLLQKGFTDDERELVRRAIRGEMTEEQLFIRLGVKGAFNMARAP